MVVADAVARHDLELRQPAHERPRRSPDRGRRPTRSRGSRVHARRARPQGRARATADAGGTVPRSGRRPCPCRRGHENVERLHAIALSAFQRPAGHGTCDGHGQPRRHVSRPAAPPRAAPHAAGFPLLCGARSEDRRASRRPMRRERRRQDQSPRGPVSARARPRPAPGRTRRVRAPRGRAAGSRCRSRSSEDGETRQLGSAWSPADAGGAAERRNRIDRAPVSSSRAFSDHVRVVWLTPAMDSLFAGPAGERRRFLDRFVLAIDPGHGARVNAFERSLARPQPAARRGAAQRRLARRDRARGGRARRRDRGCAARMREPARGADRRRARRFLALSLGATGARRRGRGAGGERPGARRRGPLPRAAARQPRPRRRRRPHPRSVPTSATSRSGTAPRTRRPRARRPASRRRCSSASRSPTRGSSRTCRGSSRSRSSTRSRRISIRAAGAALFDALVAPRRTGVPDRRRPGRLRRSRRAGGRVRGLGRGRREAEGSGVTGVGRQHAEVGAELGQRAVVFGGVVGVEDESGGRRGRSASRWPESRSRAGPSSSRRSRARAPRATGRRRWRWRAGCRWSR